MHGRRARHIGSDDLMVVVATQTGECTPGEWAAASGRGRAAVYSARRRAEASLRAAG